MIINRINRIRFTIFVPKKLLNIQYQIYKFYEGCFFHMGHTVSKIHTMNYDQIGNKVNIYNINLNKIK